MSTLFEKNFRIASFQRPAPQKRCPGWSPAAPHFVLTLMVQNLWTTGFFHASPPPYHLVKICLLYSHWCFWPFPLSIQFHALLFVLIAVFHKNTPNTGCPVLGIHIRNGAVLFCAAASAFYLLRPLRVPTVPFRLIPPLRKGVFARRICGQPFPGMAVRFAEKSYSAREKAPEDCSGHLFRRFLPILQCFLQKKLYK